MKKLFLIVCFLAVIVLSAVIMLIDIQLMQRTAEYISANSLSPAIILGSERAVYLEWLRLLLTPCIILIAAAGVFWAIWKDL